MALSGNRKFFAAEAKAEEKAVIEVGSTSSVDILRVNKLEIKFPSSESKRDRRGNVIEIVAVEVRGQDIFDKGTWEKFLRHENKYDADMISLVNDTLPLTEAYDRFLDTSYTERYRNLDAEGQLWRLKVVELAVKYHIMENKLNGYLEGDDTFASEPVAYLYALYRAIKTAMAGAARVINHIVKDEDKRQLYLDEFFNTHYERLKSIPFPQRDEMLSLIGSEEV